jgi:hypothetical protein
VLDSFGGREGGREEGREDEIVLQFGKGVVGGGGSGEEWCS